MTPSALYLKDAQRFLDQCITSQEKVSVKALRKDGVLVSYEGWTVLSSFWKQGTFRLKNPVSGQIRVVHDVLIMSINDHPVYI